MKLSALIISYNEEKHIGKCLSSLQGLVDEIIVVDSYSTDRTAEICGQFDTRFVQRNYTNQIDQKQYALSLASYPMIMSLDADEKIDEQLRENIQTEKTLDFPFDGYHFERRAFYCGQWIRYGNWSSEWKIRLWKKEMADWQGSNPHDRVALQQNRTSKKLKGHLHHYTFEHRSEHEAQIKKYAQISAESYLREGRTLTVIRVVLSPVFYLIKSYLLKGGFLDGQIGWQIAYLSMKEKYLKYLYLINTKN